MWDVFRVSSDKLALCHLELMRKMNDLIRDINKYGEEQVKIHRKVGARARARRSLRSLGSSRPPPPPPHLLQNQRLSLPLH